MTAHFVIRNKYWWQPFCANNEPDQVKTFTDLDEILDSVGDIQNKNVVFGGDFNVIFDLFLEVQGGNQVWKNTL